MGKKILCMLFLFISIILMIETVSAHEKKYEIKINEDGTSTYKLTWNITLANRFSYIPVSDWGIQIPKQSKIISVKDAKGNLPYKIEIAPDNNYNFIKFKNRGTLFYNSKYFFEIEYIVEKNPLIYEPNYFYKDVFTRFDNDDAFSIFFSLPENASIMFSSQQPQQTQLNAKNKILTYSLNKGETKEFKIYFLIPEKSSTLTKISSDFYTIEIPARYEEDYISLLKKADSSVLSLEKIYGFPSFYKWKIEIISPEAKDFNETAEGFYLGEGKMRIKLSYLTESEQQSLYLITHETAHGFNSKIYNDNVPNFWGQEGLAQYAAFKALEEQGYNFTETKKQMLELSKSCMDYDKSLITGWSPNVYLSPGSDVTINCTEQQTTKKNLGYAYSFLIINSIVDKYGEKIIQKFFKTAEQLNITFSSNRNILNNQMNYVLTKAVGSDTTDFLNSLGLNVEKIDDKNKNSMKTILTGMPIYEQEKEINKLKARITLLILIMAIIVILIIHYKKTKKK